ncbi:hypothetical protein BDFB_011186, partial [Asbolus verrucosus]
AIVGLDNLKESIATVVLVSVMVTGYLLSVFLDQVLKEVVIHASAISVGLLLLVPCCIVGVKSLFIDSESINVDSASVQY